MATCNENISILEEVRAKYQTIAQPLRLKVSANDAQKKFLVGNYIIFNSKKLIEQGGLIQVKFKLRTHNRHKLGNCRMFVVIGQVIDILESKNGVYKTLIRVLDLEKLQ